MSVKSFTVRTSLAAVSLAAAMSLALAQTPAPAGARPYAPAGAHRPRIEVNPRPLLHRRCVDWYVLQCRPSGTVLFPQQHCWWVLG